MTAHVSPARGAALLDSAENALAAARVLAGHWRAVGASIDAERRVPRRELAALELSGLLSITVPVAFGGPDLGMATLIEVFLILATADTALAQVPQNHFDFVDTLLVAQPETRAFFYAEVLAGARFGNALAEPNRASRSDLKTTIAEIAGDYIVDGTKIFSTGALTAKWVPVHALHADGRVRTAYIANGSPGMEIREDWDAFGQRATFSGTTVLNQVRVPGRNVVDRSLGDPGLIAAQHAGNQLIHAAIEAGSALGAVEAAVTWLTQNDAAASVQTAAVGELLVEIEAAKASVRRAARMVDQALAHPSCDMALAASIAVDEAKSLAYETGPQASSALTDLLPAEAATRSLRFDRFWRNTRTHSMHDPVRWRQAFVGDFHLNGRPSADLRARLKLSDLPSSQE